MPNNLSAYTGDENSYRKLFDEYVERVHAYIISITRSDYLAEEVTQELFLILWRKREDLNKVENMDGYIFRIARNLAINLLRKASLDSRLAAELYKRSIKESNTTSEEMSRRNVQELIDKALLTLPAQPRKIYLMSRRENMNFDEIAEATGLSRNTVKNHLQKALNDLREYLIRHGYQLMWAALLTHKIDCC